MPYATVFFLHLPKTAGTTMRRVLDREYRTARRYEIGEDVTGDIRAFRSRPWDADNAPNLVQGHMSYGLHEFVPGPSTYVTLLREPIRRALSDYHYVTSTPGHPIHEHVKDLSLVEYFESGITGQLSNGQVRLLSGDHLPEDRGVPSNRRMERADLERARANLEDNFTAVGVQERFDETLLLFRRRLGWRWPFYVRENVTSRPYRREDIPDEDLARVRELNLLDIELYDIVRHMFDRVVAAEGGAFARDLAAFRVLNRAWGILARNLPPSLRQAGGRAWRGLARAN
ncbi:MAG: sulfotransferase family 2 domain-containing protein [Gammaproteobacteria bacterium]|nr:sulfotransferase family 2 domain-containing protein [Gammaproteobacteria bacterium]